MGSGINGYVCYYYTKSLQELQMVRMGCALPGAHPILTQEEMNQLYQQVLSEMQTPAFCGSWYYLTVWGNKPDV
jgi:hypothetical protein